jgi:hypothetical protein
MALRASICFSCAKRHILLLRELCGLNFFSVNSVLNLPCLFPSLAAHQHTSRPPQANYGTSPGPGFLSASACGRPRQDCLTFGENAARLARRCSAVRWKGRGLKALTRKPTLRALRGEFFSTPRHAEPQAWRPATRDAM